MRCGDVYLADLDPSKGSEQTEVQKERTVSSYADKIVYRFRWEMCVMVVQLAG